MREIPLDSKDARQEHLFILNLSILVSFVISNLIRFYSFSLNH